MWQHGIHVRPATEVSAGQHIGDVGSSGMSHRSAPALRGPARRHERRSHRRRRLAQPARSREPPRRDQRITRRLQQRRAAGTPAGSMATPTGSSTIPPAAGKITARMLHLYQQTLAAFPDTGWGCYSPRPGTKSEHPLGRACDITFGNRSANAPTPRSSTPAGPSRTG
jgi:hypothetical protein